MRDLEAKAGIYPEIQLSDKQWDVVRDALMQRGTKEARGMAERIWKQLVPQRLRHAGGRCRCHPELRLIDGRIGDASDS